MCGGRPVRGGWQRLLLVVVLLVIGTAVLDRPAIAQGAFQPDPAAADAGPRTPTQIELDEEAAGDGDGDFLDQDPASVGRSLYSQCWGCTIFDVFVVKGVQTANGVAQSMQGEMLAILGIFTICYMLAKIGGGLAVGDASDLPTRFFAAYKMGIVAAIAAAFLQGSAVNNVWEYIVGPVLDIPLSAAYQIAGASGATAGSCGAGAPGTGNAIGDETLASMRQMICMMHQASAGGMAKAWAFVQTGTGIADRIIRFVIGALMILCFFWVSLTFPARFIDAFIRLMAVILLAPVFIVCAAFKHTRSYALIAVRNILYVGMLMLFMSFMFVVAVGVIGAVSSLDPNAVGDMVSAGYASNPVSGVAADVANVVLSLPYYLFAIGATLIINRVIAQGPELAQQFSETRVSSGAGDGVIGAAAGVVSAPVKGAGAVVGAQMAGRGLEGLVASGVARGASAGMKVS